MKKEGSFDVTFDHYPVIMTIDEQYNRMYIAIPYESKN